MKPAKPFLTIRMITEDIWVSMKDLSVVPIHQADMHLSEEKNRDVPPSSCGRQKIGGGAAGDGSVNDSLSLDCQLSTPMTSHESV